MAPGAGHGRQLAGVTFWLGWFPDSAQVTQVTSFGQISYLRPAWVLGREAISYQDGVVKRVCSFQTGMGNFKESTSTECRGSEG